jgi:DNA repair protein RecO (recombination protein O)
MAQEDLQPAYVLHTRRFSESSLLVEFLTRDQGRIALLAKGALNSKNARQALLQPFVPLFIAWRGRGELPTLTSLDAAGNTLTPQGRVLYCGLYMNELLLHFIQRQDPHSQLFISYAACLLSLLETDGSNQSIEPILRRFELALLDELGMGLNLSHDQQHQSIQSQAYYEYDILDGARLAQPGKRAVMGASLLALAMGKFDNQQQRLEARQLMRQVLDYHLAGKILKSRELFL